MQDRFSPWYHYPDKSLAPASHGRSRLSALIRILQSLPLVIALGVLAIVVYLVVSWRKSPTRAKEVLIKVFLVLTTVLSLLFLLATIYAVIEANVAVAELFGAFLVVSAIALAITLVCRARFHKNHPNYQYTPQKARTHSTWENTLRKFLEFLGRNAGNPRS